MNNFIAYRKPGKHCISQFNIQREISELEFLEFGGFVMAPFNKLGRKIYLKGNETEFVPNHISDENSAIKRYNGGSEYKAAINNAINDIANNELQKVVVSKQIQFEGRLSYMEIFLDLAETHKKEFVYIFVYNDVTYLGATPEVLISKRGNVINSASLAGTVALIDNDHFAPWSEKEYQEHKFVTHFIFNIYEKYCDQVRVSERVELLASKVKHLFQEISGELNKGFNLFDILAELHPTPAIAGLPADKAIRWIDQNELYNREYYTGYLGLYSPKEADLYVNLRCLKYQNEITTIYVGGGIVEGSTFESEFEETEHKAETLLSSIRKFHTIELEHK